MKIIATVLIPISIGLTACDNKVNQQSVAASAPKISAPEPQPDPYSFKDFKLGMSLSDFTALKPRITYKNDSKKFEASRFIDTTIGSSKAKAFVLFNDYGKGLQLSYISITISKSDFSNATLALTAKYGDPKIKSEISKSNAMGATFHGERLIWNNGISTITAEGIGSKIDESDINFSHLKLGQSLQDKQDSEKAKKDI